MDIDLTECALEAHLCQNKTGGRYRLIDRAPQYFPGRPSHGSHASLPRADQTTAAGALDSTLASKSPRRCGPSVGKGNDHKHGGFAPEHPSEPPIPMGRRAVRMAHHALVHDPGRGVPPYGALGRSSCRCRSALGRRGCLPLPGTALRTGRHHDCRLR